VGIAGNRVSLHHGTWIQGRRALLGFLRVWSWRPLPSTRRPPRRPLCPQTLGAIFGVSLGATRLLKDNFAVAGTQMDEEGRTLASSTRVYMGEIPIIKIATFPADELASLASLTFSTPSGKLVIFVVEGIEATPADEDDAVAEWSEIVLQSAAGSTLFFNGSSVTYLRPGTDITEPFWEYLTAGTEDEVEASSWCSVFMSVRAGNWAPKPSSSSSRRRMLQADAGRSGSSRDGAKAGQEAQQKGPKGQDTNAGATCTACNQTNTEIPPFKTPPGSGSSGGGGQKEQPTCPDQPVATTPPNPNGKAESSTVEKQKPPAVSTDKNTQGSAANKKQSRP